MFRRFIKANVRISQWIDRRLFPGMCSDGNTAFNSLLVASSHMGCSCVDVGCGKTPFFDKEEKVRRGLHVIGVDIDASELAMASDCSLDERIVGSIEEVRGNGACDFAVAQSVLEHVRNGKSAATGISSFVTQGGMIYTFCPNRRAWFAMLNRVLPEDVKRQLLFAIFPEKRDRQGFPAFYDGCTPAELCANMAAADVVCVELRPYFVSSYFMFFVPLYLFWRVMTYPLMSLWPLVFCETFVFVGRKGGPALKL